MLISACAQKVPKVDFAPYVVNSGTMGMEEYGVTIKLPENLSLVEAWEFDLDGARIYKFYEKESGSIFRITTYKNYCNINDIDLLYVWGYLKGCKETEKKNISSIYGKNVEFDYHVYSSQAIYFKKGSFISPTIVFGTKSKPLNGTDYDKTKSLAYAYRFNDSYYILELGFSASPDQFEQNNELLAKLIKSVVYLPQ